MNWTTVTTPQGRQRHHAKTEIYRLSVYDECDGRNVCWHVLNTLDDKDIAHGQSLSADEAKQAAEQAAMKGVR